MEAEGGGRELGSSDNRCPREVGFLGPSGTSFGPSCGCPLRGRGLEIEAVGETSMTGGAKGALSLVEVCSGRADPETSSLSRGVGRSLFIRLMT